jgi:hypothetical protein
MSMTKCIKREVFFGGAAESHHGRKTAPIFIGGIVRAACAGTSYSEKPKRTVGSEAGNVPEMIT